MTNDARIGSNKLIYMNIYRSIGTWSRDDGSLDAKYKFE